MKDGKISKALKPSPSTSSALVDSNASFISSPPSSTDNLLTDRQPLATDETPKKVRERDHTHKTKTPTSSAKHDKPESERLATRIDLTPSQDKQNTLRNMNNELYDDESSQPEIISFKREAITDKQDEMAAQSKTLIAESTDTEVSNARVKSYSNLELIFTPTIKDDDDKVNRAETTAAESSVLNKSARSSRRTRTIELSVRVSAECLIRKVSIFIK
jgi:hypothetical protein